MPQVVPTEGTLSGRNSTLRAINFATSSPRDFSTRESQHTTATDSANNENELSFIRDTSYAGLPELDSKGVGLNEPCHPLASGMEIMLNESKSTVDIARETLVAKDAKGDVTIQIGRNSPRSGISRSSSFSDSQFASSENKDSSEEGTYKLPSSGILSGRRDTRRFTAMPGSPGKARGRVVEIQPSMFMGHPVGSAAADFLERQKLREHDVKLRKKEIVSLLQSVMENDPALPDVDKLFPAEDTDPEHEDRLL